MRDFTFYFCQSDPSCLQVKPPEVEEAVAAFLVKEKRRFLKNLMMSSHLLFTHDLSAI